MGYFSAHPDGAPFHLFGARHLIALALTGAGVAGVVATGRRLGPVGRRRAKAAIVASLWGQEVAYHAWKARHGMWNARDMLPLHLCSILVWVGGANLIRPTRLGDDVTWYWGISGAPQALLTPDLAEYGDRHFRFHQFFISHGFLLTIPLWQVFVEGRRPTAAGGVRAFVMLLVLAGHAHLANRHLGSNYMFVTRKPDTASLLDRLPPWPGYIPYLAAIGAAIFGAAWAPFGIADALRAHRPQRRG